MVVARVIFPPTVISVSQTALDRPEHVLHIVKEVRDPNIFDVSHLSPKQAEQVLARRWPNRYVTACGKAIDGCPLTYRPTRACDPCEKSWSSKKGFHIAYHPALWSEFVLLDEDVDRWLERLFARVRLFGRHKHPPIDVARERYLLPS